MTEQNPIPTLMPRSSSTLPLSTAGAPRWSDGQEDLEEGGQRQRQRSGAARQYNDECRG